MEIQGQCQSTKMAAGGTSPKQFSNDEAFPDPNDDAIRVYGATTEMSPLNLKSHYHKGSNDKVRVWIQDPNERLTIPSDDTASRDSDSLMRRTDSSENEFNPSQPCWRHPKIKDNWKIVLAAGALLVVGLSLFLVGVALTFMTSFTQAIVFYIAGVICFVPGVYHLVYIYFAVKGRRGYYFYHLPLFN